MDTEKISAGACPIGRGLAKVGDTWSMLILRDAGLGLTRFDQFRTSLGIAPNILTRRLKALTDSGLLEKRPYSEHPPREEYLITEAGRDFLPVLQAIGAWGRRHNGGGPISPMIAVQTGAAGGPGGAVRCPAGPIRSRPPRPCPPPPSSSPLLSPPTAL